MIARCQRKLTSIESDKNKEIQNITSNIFTKYQEEINKVKSVEKEPWESQSEYDSKISKAVIEVEGKRDTELNGVESKVNIKYDNQYKMVELQMNKLVENLQNTSFVIKGDSVQVLLGSFNAEAKPKNWPVSIKSLDKLVNYTYNGKRTVSDADVKTEYKAMESARASNSLEGEIIYKILKGSSNFDYEIKVVSVRVYNSENGTTVVNETVNQMVGSVGANAQLSGESRYEKSAKKEKRTPAVSDYVAREDTEINNVSINVMLTCHVTFLTNTVYKFMLTFSFTRQKKGQQHQNAQQQTQNFLHDFFPPSMNCKVIIAFFFTIVNYFYTFCQPNLYSFVVN